MLLRQLHEIKRLDDNFLGSFVQHILTKVSAKKSVPQVNYEIGEVVTLTFLSKQSNQSGKFFYDMVSRYLIPGRKISVTQSFTTELEEESGEHFTLGQIVVSPKNAADVDVMRKNLPFLAGEIELGLRSFYHSVQVLEAKGLSKGEKDALIQEKIMRMIHRFPTSFDYDLVHAMQELLFTFKESYSAIRDYRYLVKMITHYYLMQKELKAHRDHAPGERLVAVRLIESSLQDTFGPKPVLGVCVSLNLLSEKESFGEKHLNRVLKHIFPGQAIVPESVWQQRRGELITLYAEVEQSERIGSEERARLLGEIEERVERGIEHSMPSLFMPRNEEEVMRNILILSHQLKYMRDLPQVIITFDGQSENSLSFTIVLVRVLLPESKNTSELIDGRLDRVKQVGLIRKRYPKEAAVFRMRVPYSIGMREDHSIDLYRSRQWVLRRLIEKFGEVRDYNGGMISKQAEIFSALQDELGSVGKKHQLLLENFFHAIFPVELRSMASPAKLSTLFQMLLGGVREEKLTLACSDHSLFILCSPDHPGAIVDAVEKLNIPTSSLITMRLTPYLGYIFHSEDPSNHQLLINTIIKAS